MKIKLFTILASTWTIIASAQSQFAGTYGGTVADTTYGDPNAGTFAVFVGTNGQATVIGYDVDSFQNHNSGQSGGVAAQFNIPANGNWNFSSNNTIYGCSGSGLITNGIFSGTLTFTNGDTVLLTNGYQQSPLGTFQHAAGYYSGPFSGNFGGPVSGTNVCILSANGQFVVCTFVNGALNDGGQGQIGSNNQFTSTNFASGTWVSGTLTNATLKIGGISSNQWGSATWTMSRLNYVFQVATTNLPNGTTTVPYSQSLAAYGGPTNYTWGIASGSLPTGLSLSSSGVISGTPTVAGTNNFTVRATNALNSTTTQALSLVIYTFSTSVTFAVTPTTVSNTYPGTISLLASNLASGETVTVQKYLDLNTNGIIDGSDWLVQQFNLTDGQAGMVIGGVTNFNVPGDLNGTAGNITATLNFNNGDFMQNIVGKYVYKLSSPVGHFAPITTNFTVTNFPFPQKFTGYVVSNGTSTTLSNAVVMVFQPNSPPLAGVVANNSGNYTIAVPTGTYSLVPFQSNYVATFSGAPVFTLTNTQTLTTNLSLVIATNIISGRLVDANNTNIGLAGVFFHAQSTNGLIASAMSDTNGNFKMAVTNGTWELQASETSLLVPGYVGLSNKTNVTAGATGLILAVPKATALIYGNTKDNLGNPMVAVNVGVNDNNWVYYTDTLTDTNGNYVLGVLGGLGSSDPWQVSPNDNGTVLTNYVFSQTVNQNGGTNINTGTAVTVNISALLATNYLTGTVKDSSGNPISGVGVTVAATINGTNYATWLDTDANGHYSLNLANGNWSISINCNSGKDSLDNILGVGNYNCPNNQSVVINNNNATNNSIVQLCNGISIVTPSPLPIGEVNVGYNESIQASDCSGTYNWSQTSGSLPGNLNLYPNGSSYSLSGTPTTSGTFTFTIQVNDGSGHTTNRQFSASISNALQITSSSLPNGTNGSAYSQQLQASGGQPPYTNWFISSGSLPANLNLSANGLLSGTAATSGTFNFTVGLSDSLGGNVAQPLSLTLNSTNVQIPPAMGITLAGGQTFVCYPASGSNFVLQTATNVNGPWSPATNVVPAIAIMLTNNVPAQFFRLH